MKKIMCAVTAVAAFVSVTTSVQAAEPEMRVKVSDLNLASEAGAARALARIAAAASCDKTLGAQPIERVWVQKRCVADMTRSGVEELDASMAHALFEGHPVAKSNAQIASAR